ncbi:uncharacterized protein LTR77_003404 [Saxophila tyrrhenica]|uniref:Uncharacterized protein n=1 Tax=Saxophila tyrrhenica TaxID=1690608 RepID=A0AAV9PDP0_9PEZI|nr:hypothetical protein LTR77_003404 [Saxophila tyrrhenica]
MNLVPVFETADTTPRRYFTCFEEEYDVIEDWVAQHKLTYNHFFASYTNYTIKAAQRYSNLKQAQLLERFPVVEFAMMSPLLDFVTEKGERVSNSIDIKNALVDYAVIYEAGPTYGEVDIKNKEANERFPNQIPSGLFGGEKEKAKKAKKTMRHKTNKTIVRMEGVDLGCGEDGDEAKEDEA